MARQGPEYLRSSTKRQLDILGSAAVGLALLPAGAVAYTAAAIDNRSARPFYRHERVGENGESFTLTKLRTLRPELVTDTIGRGTNDPRATGIGKMLRRYGLDEIPQLRSIVEGEMSLIGIRASSDAQLRHLQEHAPRIFDEWYEAYESGRPGLLGPAQIYRRNYATAEEEDVDQTLRMDIDYVKQASLFNDLRILGSAPLKLLAANLSTAPAVPESLPVGSPAV